MSAHSIFDRDGYVKLPPRVGDEPYQVRKNATPQAEIDFCMECKKTNCKHGTCRNLKKMKREMKEEEHA